LVLGRGSSIAVCAASAAQLQSVLHLQPAGFGVFGCSKGFVFFLFIMYQYRPHVSTISPITVGAFVKKTLYKFLNQTCGPVNLFY
jgi:hypothetical protein